MFLNDAVIERAKCKGMLKKQGGKWKTWKNRFFVLDESTLYYLESPKDRKAKGVIYLQGLVIEGAENETSLDVIQANDERDYKMWLDALRNAVFMMKQSAVGAKDAPSTAHSHVKGSKPAADRLDRQKHLSRSTDPIPSSPRIALPPPTSQTPPPRRVFSADADKFNNRISMSENDAKNNNANADNNLSGNNNKPPPSSNDEESVAANFRKSVFDKAVNGLFAQPSSEILVEKEKKGILRSLSLRGSGAKSPELRPTIIPPSPSPLSRSEQLYSTPSEYETSSWEKGSVFDTPSTSTPTPKLSHSSNTTTSNNNNNNNNKYNNERKSVVKQNLPEKGAPRDLHILITPWNDLAKDTLFALLQKAKNPLYAKTTLSVKIIMASSVPERTREELVGRGVEVASPSWDDEEQMTNTLKDINKVIFLPGQSQHMADWASAILKATCRNPNKISQLIRVGVLGMQPPTRLGQWAQTIDSMFEEEQIVSTTVLVDQLYQEICPSQGGLRASTQVVVPWFAAEASITPVDSRDVAVLLGTIALRDVPGQSSDITLTGPATLTFKQIGQIMNDQLGFSLSFSPHSPQNVTLREMFEVFKVGSPQVNPKNVEKMESIIGRSLYTFEAFLGDCILKRKK